MNNESFEEEKLTPKWKVALIPILGVIMIVVLIPKADAKQEAAKKASSLGIKADLPEKKQTDVNVSELPTGSLESASQFNPFKMGEPLLKLTVGIQNDKGPTPEEIAAQRKLEQEAEQKRLQKLAVMEKIKNLKVSLVIQTETGVAAIIDSQTVRVGDEIQPGVIVTHIGNDGLKVTLKNSEFGESGGNAKKGEEPLQ